MQERDTATGQAGTFNVVAEEAAFFKNVIAWYEGSEPSYQHTAAGGAHLVGRRQGRSRPGDARPWQPA